MGKKEPQKIWISTQFQVLETVAQREASLLHLHLDLDVLDPAEFPHVRPGVMEVLEVRGVILGWWSGATLPKWHWLTIANDHDIDNL